ncbi:uncharacterized protein NECHADRAFT_105211 [Fusarium vanettenii 77-13-4]|uniref:Zn(2)-C6 fungal-type domain-containing protein n=1 Tax=Fusarium vanettenii (strain ATCC MYA-4622 / CBS 123669 / FGSC 9596 / NRRL 45880 / 77-13-4) TaxID=660122 RepID=C7ZD87_FUSV7|nr:uncharacterized protein NECHADRAFT_105211 [Fusarium vanettenii 77-13-4]EEU38178.1 hypothetical protein NECHADRAFT_105211 [Fusarium vanettenii 77-13-4]
MKRQTKLACDQCRRSKRACDAPPLELPDHDSFSNGTIVLGKRPASETELQPCSYCTKTKKQCTMNWAWSQVQITAALAAAAREDSSLECIIPGKRRQSSSKDVEVHPAITDTASFSIPACQPGPSQGPPQGLFSQELPNLDLSFPEGSLGALPFVIIYPLGRRASVRKRHLKSNSTIPSQPRTKLNRFLLPVALLAPDQVDLEVTRVGKGKNATASLSPFSIDQSMMARSNTQFISTNLLKIYHDVLEHNLSCWLTEVTCPYRPGSNTSPHSEWGASWTNRIYIRTQRLDRVAQSAKLIQLTRSEDQAATRALHLAIMAFATQWAQGSRRQRERYHPFGDPFEDGGPEDFLDEISEEFDRNIQKHFWEQAQKALQDVADVESYRVACAELVFGLTQKPWGRDDDSTSATDGFDFLLGQERRFDADSMMAELGDIISRDGAPVMMERAARKMHALKFQFDSTRRGLDGFRRGKQASDSLSVMSPEDRGTVGLLFWLSIMFDTVSSSMNERPVVVSDAESQHDDARQHAEGLDGQWNVPLFIQDSLEQPYRMVHWPCTYEAAAEAVTKSAPVKVLLYRHVSYLQNILRKGGRGEKVESIIRNSISVFRYWNLTHGAFFKELLHDYEAVPGRIQSWFVCISCHWHLAALMLADLIEYVDENELGVASVSYGRLGSKMVSKIREASTRELSDLAKVSTPDRGTTGMISPSLSHFHDAVNEATILTEPWTIILIRAFSKAAVLLISEANDFLEFGLTTRGSFQESLARADECTKGLWLLGKKSDMARSVADRLSLAIQKLKV